MVALLPVAYVASVASLIFVLNAEIVPLNGATEPIVHAYIAPLWSYMNLGWDTEWSGAKECQEIISWSKAAGQRVSGE